jgi:hypothetical protein
LATIIAEQSLSRAASRWRRDFVPRRKDGVKIAVAGDLSTKGACSKGEPTPKVLMQATTARVTERIFSPQASPGVGWVRSRDAKRQRQRGRRLLKPPAAAGRYFFFGGAMTRIE